MKGGFVLTLVLSLAGGVLLTAGLGGAFGVFDRGPSELDVSNARERGRAEATAEIDSKMEAAATEQEELGYQRGTEAAEWLSLDRLPNPDSWFAGVQAGRVRLEELAEIAYEAGLEDGERQGRDEALGALRLSEEAPPTEVDSDDGGSAEIEEQ